MGLARRPVLLDPFFRSDLRIAVDIRIRVGQYPFCGPSTTFKGTGVRAICLFAFERQYPL
jgi:hypothetical protein